VNLTRTSNPRNALKSLLHRLGVAGPARVRAFRGTGASKVANGTSTPSLISSKNNRAGRPFIRVLLLTIAATLTVLAFTAAPAFAEAPEAPLTKEVTEISNTSATVRGVLDPLASETLELGWDVAYNEGSSCAGGIATHVNPPTEVPPATAITPTTIGGLQPGTEYTACLVAVNEEGEAPGNEVSFTTTALGPAVEEESFLDVSSSSAELSARVDTYGSAGEYQFEYASMQEEDCFASAGCAKTSLANIGSGSGAVSVGAHVEGLQPETTYRFRVLVKSALGEVGGAQATFSTFPPVSLGLPDSRGYELVSSLADRDTDVFEPQSYVFLGYYNNPLVEQVTTEPFRAAADGDALAYVATPPLEGGSGAEQSGKGNEYLARRSTSGAWTASSIQPTGLESPEYQSFSSDLATGILNSTEPLTPTAPSGGFADLYAQSLSDGSYQPLSTVTPPHRTVREPSFEAFDVNVFGEHKTKRLVYAGASADRSHMLFEANDALTEPESADGGFEANNLYDSVGGALRSINILPGGAPAPNATFGSSSLEDDLNNNFIEEPDFDNVISANGSRIFWTDLNTDVVYLRENDTASEERCARPQPASEACTVQVSEGTAPAQYWTATPNGRYAYYTEGGVLYRFDTETGERQALTPEGYGATGTADTAGKPGIHSVTSTEAAEAELLTSVTGHFKVGQNLYGAGIPPGAYITAVKETEHELKISRPALATASEVSIATGGAETQGVLGINETGTDGEYVYFVASGSLASGAEPRKCRAAHEEQAEDLSKQEQELLDREEREEGEAILPSGRGCNLYVLHTGESARFIAAVLHGDDELHADPVGDWRPDLGFRTAYVTPDGRHLLFASEQGPAGYKTQPQSEEVYMYDFGSARPFCVSCNPSGAPQHLAGAVRDGAELRVSWNNTYMLRDISADGDRVFFESNEALTPQDTNEQMDVYEWERDATGSCTRMPGCLYLLSGGTSTGESYFLDASESGNDVFISTRAPLVAQAQSDAFEVYDVRVGAPQAPTSPACTASGCQGVPAAPPIFATPASVTFSGSGNFQPPPPPPPVKPKPETRAQKLKKAIHACRKDRAKKRRRSCEASARKRYGAKASRAKKTRQRNRTGR
jgi:hypothetical protein